MAIFFSGPDIETTFDFFSQNSFEARWPFQNGILKKYFFGVPHLAILSSKSNS
jgi:hypothetical protein